MAKSLTTRPVPLSLPPVATKKTVKDQPAFESKIAKAVYTGKLLAQRAIDKGVKKVVFDRNGFLYHGRIKAFSDGAREAGLDF